MKKWIDFAFKTQVAQSHFIMIMKIILIYLKLKVWVNAAAQNFNSLGIAFGSVMSFSSYNRFNNQILFDTLAVSTINGFTSILVGIFAFATIGNIASEQGTPIESVVSDGE